MICFKQHDSPKYPPRTWENASADATLAFAFDFNTPGEQLTRGAVSAQNKKYIAIIPSMISSLKIKNVATILSDIKATTINIAGNSLPVIIKYGFTQTYCDQLVYEFLRMVLKHPAFDCNIQMIRTGGQSGFDESGAKAAIKLGLPTLICCPKGFKFVNEHGETVCDEILFKKRFEL